MEFIFIYRTISIQLFLSVSKYNLYVVILIIIKINFLLSNSDIDDNASVVTLYAIGNKLSLMTSSLFQLGRTSHVVPRTTFN